MLESATHMPDLPSSHDAPDLYVDSVRIGTSPYGLVFDFGLASLEPGPKGEPSTTRVAIVRMSPQHAVVMSKVLAKQLATFQEQAGRINVPRAVFEALGLEPE